MSSISNIPPTIPFHVAQAYGVRPAQHTTPAAQTAPTRASGPTGPSSKLPTAAQKLVGATVPGRVDFSGDQPTQTTDSTLQLYRRPAERNAAATAVSIGRSLDVRG